MKTPEKASFIILLMIGLISMTLMAIKPVKAYAGTNLFADPPVFSSKNLHVGSKFNVSIMLENGTDVVTIAFDLRWNTSYLNVTELYKGGCLPGAVLMIGNWDPAAGKIEGITYGVLGAQYDVDLGIAIIAEFEVMHLGSSLIDIYNMDCWNALMVNFLTGDCPYDCTAHISEVIQHPVDYDEDGTTDFYVETESNSTVTTFSFDLSGKAVLFNVTGFDGTGGYVNVTIPKALLDIDGNLWTVWFGSTSATPTVTSNATRTFIYLSYTHSLIKSK